MPRSVKIGGGAAVAMVAVLAFFLPYPPVRSRLDALAEKAKPLPSKDPSVVPPMIVGMNLGSPAYFSSEEMFADPIQTRGELFLVRDGTSPLTDQLKLDANGRPIDVPAGTTLLSRVHDGVAPLISGKYRCKVAPGWRVEGSLGGQPFQQGTNFTIDVPKVPNATVDFKVIAERDGVSLSELSCRFPNDQGKAIFRADFLDDMRPFRVLRFMDWMTTNNEPLRKWSERTTPNSIWQGRHGMSVEYMVALANELRADPWFTLPLDADEGYYRNFATYVHDHLDPDLKAYVELSNEVWNDGFQQAKDATARGKKLYPGVTDDQANDYYYADRVRDLMSTWTDVYKGEPGRIVRVLASMLWDKRGEQRLSHKDTYKYVDALAIAPYFGEVPNDIPLTGKARVEAVIARTPKYIQGVLEDGVRDKALAAKYGLPLITYEGGPGYWAYDPEGVKDMEAVASDPRIYALYQTFLRRWQKEVGGLLVVYQGTTNTLFGHKQYTGQPMADTPKMRALVDFIHALPPEQQPRPPRKPAY